MYVCCTYMPSPLLSLGSWVMIAVATCQSALFIRDADKIVKMVEWVPDLIEG
jgi:hypothetical protein